MAKTKKLTAKAAAEKYADNLTNGTERNPMMQFIKNDCKTAFLAGVAWSRRQGKLGKFR